jgi:pimeloyl-ACP methyl ester carboxylesterase
VFPEPTFIDTNGIQMAVHEQGKGAPVVLLHGFPELAFSWRHQMPALADAGYRAIAPDQRGYGRTTVPPHVSDYAIDELIADLHGLLDALGLESATFVGHDWGALVLWSMAMLAPERIDRMVVLNIPHYPRPAENPIALFRKRLGDDFYIVDFQDSNAADELFAADPGRVFDRMMRKNTIRRREFDLLPAAAKSLSLLRLVASDSASGDALLSAAERDYFVSAFKKTGFTGPINWYRNWTRNWERMSGTDETINIPTLFVFAADDVLIAPQHVDNMRSLVRDLEVHTLEPCGHWSQQERPHDVNRLMVDWLSRKRIR